MHSPAFQLPMMALPLDHRIIPKMSLPDGDCRIAVNSYYDDLFYPDYCRIVVSKKCNGYAANAPKPGINRLGTVFNPLHYVSRHFRFK